MPGRFGRRFNRDEEKVVFSMEAWQPKTNVGKLVKEGKIKSIEEVFALGKPIKEMEIVDALVPNLEDTVLEIASVQRMTKNSRKQKFRVTVVIGDRNGHVGIGVGKNVETRPAIQTAINNAKMKLISISYGCGSWECNCGTKHSMPLKMEAKCGSSYIILKPAPRGVGIVAGETARQVLELAGIKDVWTFSRGRTKDVYNMALATYNALRKLSEIKNVEMLKA